MDLKRDDSLKAGIEFYTGREVERLSVVEDPQVSYTFAMRARMKDGASIDFLIVGSTLDHGIAKTGPGGIADALEECEFETWPPASGRLRFF